VPIFEPGGELVAILDIDSHQPNAFDELDRRHLEAAAALVAHAFAPPASAASRAG
jgi:putative methionine-R-sulfoxide reductase with GAF domain